MSRILAPANGPQVPEFIAHSSDVQLVALMASQLWGKHCLGTPEGYALAVRHAVGIYAEAVVSQPSLVRRIQELQAAQEADKFTQAVNE